MIEKEEEEDFTQIVFRVEGLGSYRDSAQLVPYPPEKVPAVLWAAVTQRTRSSLDQVGSKTNSFVGSCHSEDSIQSEGTGTP